MSLAMKTAVAGRAAGPASASDAIKVMIVDDSAVVRGLVSRWVGAENGMEIAAKHANGQKAVDDVAQSQPDVIILDVEMPVKDGLEALPQLLKGWPGVKVVMASTLTQRNAEISMKAMALGAADYIPKPDSNSGITTSDSFRRDLLQKIKTLGKVRRYAPVRPAAGAASTASAASTAVRARGTAPARAHAASGTASRASLTATPTSAPQGKIELHPFSRTAPKILIVGSSTGGPQALVKLFEVIGPALGNVPVLVTQHMPATFTAILAKHIGDASKRTSKEGEHNEMIQPGTVYVAPGGYHMRLTGSASAPRIVLDQGPEINFCRPAVDPMFESVARIYRGAVLATILTGMGQDGAKGGRTIANAGGSVIAQDEATSVVWGMPGAAAAAGICSAVLPLPQIGPKITALLK